MTKIIRLESTNYKRLKAVEIKPDPNGGLVVIAGKNGQGKTSVLDSISAALGGVNAKNTPKPIRDGEDRAEIVLETEELIVTRKFTPSGSTLVVKSHDGSVFPKGQAKLDDLIGKLSLDPLAFTQLDAKKQLAQLIQLVELPFDVAALGAEREELFSKRTAVGVEGKRLGDPIVNSGLPVDELSSASIISSIREADRLDLDRVERGLQTAAVAELIASLERKLEEIQLSIKDALAKEKDLLHQSETAPTPPDVTELEAQLATVEETNAAIRANNKARHQVEEKNKLREEYTELTRKLASIDKTKADGLSAAKFPVDGLGFDDSGVTYQGIPFKQASGAEQLRVSLAMAIALSPELRVIRISDGSLLDSDNLALVESVAKEKDFQVWLEVVGDGDGQGLIIEDGMVA